MEAAWQGARRLGRHRMADLSGEPSQHPTQILRAARAEIGVEEARQFWWHGREGVEPGIGPVVAGQDRQGDPVGAGGCRGAFDAVAPVVEATEAADDDDLRLGDHGIDVEIHRHRVAQFGELGEAQGGGG